MELSLKKPTIADKDNILKYQAAFSKDEIIHGSSFLSGMQSIEEWLNYLTILERKETAPSNLVPSEQYVLVDGNQTILGMINLRLELNDNLRNFGGHVGYSILPSIQGMGFGTKQLSLILPIAKSKGINRLLVTCYEDNFGSRKVIENNGGLFEDQRIDPSNQKTFRRYWIVIEDE